MELMREQREQLAAERRGGAKVPLMAASASPNYTGVTERGAIKPKQPRRAGRAYLCAQVLPSLTQGFAESLSFTTMTHLISFSQEKKREREAIKHAVITISCKRLMAT